MELQHIPQACGNPITSKKKHQQFILAMDASYFEPFVVDGATVGHTVVNFKDGLSHYPADVFLQEAQSYLVIREREWLDNLKHGKWQFRTTKGTDGFKGDPCYRQFLPYCVIRIALENGEWQYFLYRREDTVGEARLAGNVSAGYGGHIDLVDVVFNEKSLIDLGATIRMSSRREIFGEETKIFNSRGELVNPAHLEVDFADQFITQETEVESLHLGIVMTLDLPVGYRVETPENELTSIEPMTARELLASGLPVEHWTRAIMEEDVRQQEMANSPIIQNMTKVLDIADQMARLKAEGKVSAALDFHDSTPLAATVTGDISFESVKDLHLDLGGQQMNDAAWNEMTTGNPTTPPSEEQMNVYITENPNDVVDPGTAQLNNDLSVIEQGLRENHIPQPFTPPWDLPPASYKVPDTRFDDEVSVLEGRNLN